MTKYEGILFTDIDGTFKRWSMFLDFFDLLMKRNRDMVSPEDMFELSELKAAWQRRTRPFDDYVNRALELYIRLLPRLDEKSFNEIMLRVVNSKYDRVYAFTRALITRYKEKNWYICAVSASPHIGVQRFCDLWGINEGFGTVHEVDQSGHFTGVRRTVNDKVKAEIVQEVLARPEFSHIERTNTMAIGDSEGDIPMLSLVGTAIAFNPSGELLKFHLESDVRQARVLVLERKDVVYEIYDRGQRMVVSQMHPTTPRRVLMSSGMKGLLG